MTIGSRGKIGVPSGMHHISHLKSKFLRMADTARVSRAANRSCPLGLSYKDFLEKTFVRFSHRTKAFLTGAVEKRKWAYPKTFFGLPSAKNGPTLFLSRVGPFSLRMADIARTYPFCRGVRRQASIIQSIKPHRLTPDT